MMYGDESRLIDDAAAEGFVKPYFGNKYSFAALLPKEGSSVDSLIVSLDAETVSALLGGATTANLRIGLPKFTSEYANELSNTLKALGMTDAFDGDKADFSGIGRLRSGQNVFISDVIHKTYISVDEKGTRAAAVTAIVAKANAIMQTRHIILDRPFVYMIVDNATNQPIFIGAMNRMAPSGAAAEDGGKTERTTPGKESEFAVYDGEKYVEIPLQFVCAQIEDEDGALLCADGERMFSSVENIVSSNDLPEIVYTDAYGVKYAEPEGWETKIALTVYREAEGGALELEGGALRLLDFTTEMPDLSTLTAGKYVLEYNYGVTKGELYSYRSAIFHLIVEQ